MRRYTIRINDEDIEVDVEQLGPENYTVELHGGRVLDVTLIDDEQVGIESVSPEISTPAIGSLPTQSKPALPTRPTPRPAVGRTSDSVRPVKGGSAAAFTAPMPGVILSIGVSVGDLVAKGDTLCVLEAMKMQNDLRSDRCGVVAQVLVNPGETVTYGQALVEFAP